jgi:CheY-like chemotaxis protein
MRSMISHLCPSCRRFNAADAQRCRTCGAELLDADTQRMPLHPLAATSSAGALWLDDLGEPQRALRPIHDPKAMSPLLTLREIQLPPAAARSARKAANRAKVRRARLRGASAANGTTSTAPEVLVLEADDSAREQLCGLLQAFGFGVRTARDAAGASALLASRPFVAAFVDIALAAADGGDGIALCKQVREASERRDSGALVLVLVVAKLRPVDRVRAKLAGCDETILKPATRGSVARLLDARGIALPSDARRT